MQRYTIYGSICERLTKPIFLLLKNYLAYGVKLTSSSRKLGPHVNEKETKKGKEYNMQNMA
ncbi:hypothetical protein Hanom_Chr02g00138071 [Helianthus anomalus]